MSEVALAASDLVVRPGDGEFALRVPSFELRAGTVTAILGPNGAGKTTLLRALAGLVAPQQGRVAGPARGAVALVFQQPVVFAGSVAWNAELPLWGRGLGRRERRARALAALARFGIEPLARRDAATLSGGERRRLALARCFATDPAALLLDEPFDDLDAAGRESLARDLVRAIHETPVAVALVTHELRQALLLADRVALLRGGALLQCGPRDEVLRHPVDGGAAAAVGMSNWFEGRVAARDADGLARIELGSGAVLRAATPLAIGSAVHVGFRPEHVKIDPDGADPDPMGEAQIEELRSDGVVVTARIECAGLRVHTHLLAGRGLGHTLQKGSRVRLSVRPEHVHAVPAS